MLWTPRRSATPFILALGLLAVATPARSAARDAFETLAASTTPVAPVAPIAAVPVEAAAAQRVCAGVQVQECYESTGSPQAFVNVGTFFDMSQRTSSRHFFVKLFTPPDHTSSYQIDGMTFVANRGGVVYPSAGVVVTSAVDPVLPNFEELTRLQRIAVTSAAGGSPTCVDLQVPVGADQLAWLVLQFPDAADSVFIAVRAESDSTDHPCDFLTRDGGDYYYRPDPRQSHHDFMISAHYEALNPKPQELQPWSLVKRLYR
jgi:hypothetical protein